MLVINWLIIGGSIVSFTLAVSFLLVAILSRRRGRVSAPRVLALVAAFCAALVDALYLAVIAQQGAPDEPWRVGFVAALIAVLALAAAAGGSRSDSRWTTALLAFASVGLIALGGLAIFSIGLGLLLAGGIALVATLQALARDHSIRILVPTLIAAGTPLLLIALGFYVVTLLPPGCPSSAPHLEGSISDGGRTTHYVCEHGRLVRWWSD